MPPHKSDICYFHNIIPLSVYRFYMITKKPHAQKIEKKKNHQKPVFHLLTLGASLLIECTTC